jgi:hypothetical protein
MQFLPQVLYGDGAVIELGQIVMRRAQPASGLHRHVRDEHAVPAPEFFDLPLTGLEKVVEIMDKEDALARRRGRSAPVEQDIAGFVRRGKRTAELLSGDDLESAKLAGHQNGSGAHDLTMRFCRPARHSFPGRKPAKLSPEKSLRPRQQRSGRRKRIRRKDIHRTIHRVSERPPSQSGKEHLTRSAETRRSPLQFFALIVYRLGQEILNLQSGVRFPVGAPFKSPPGADVGGEETRRRRVSLTSVPVVLPLFLVVGRALYPGGRFAISRAPEP